MIDGEKLEEQDPLRAQAVARLEKKKEFRAHLAAYIAVNALFVVIWAMTGAGFFWPVFPMLGWGIGLFFHAWDVYGKPPTERDILREMDRLKRG